MGLQDKLTEENLPNNSTYVFKIYTQTSSEAAVISSVSFVGAQPNTENSSFPSQIVAIVLTF